MLRVSVIGVTLMYAEKVKFIAFTFPAPHHQLSAARAAEGLAPPVRGPAV